MTKSNAQKNKKTTGIRRPAKAATTISPPGGEIGDRVEGNNNSTACSASTEESKRPNQLKSWFFTWNNYPAEAVETLESTFRKICFKYVFEHEVGESGTPHLQGVIFLKSPMRWSEFKLPQTIHWMKTKDEYKAIKYCQKDFYAHGNRMWSYGFPKPLNIIRQLRPWQEQLEQMLLEDPDDRSIKVIYNPEGGAGKTQFCKRHMFLYGSLCATGGAYGDIAYVFAKAQENGKDLNDKFTFFMNLPREMNMSHVSYRALEGIKDGLLLSPKYESTCLLFNSPHVVMFTNHLPVFGNMSADRWQIYIVENDMIRIYTEFYEAHNVVV